MNQSMSVLNSASVSMQMHNSMSSKDAKHSNHGWFPMGKGVGYNAELMPT